MWVTTKCFSYDVDESFNASQYCHPMTMVWHMLNISAFHFELQMFKPFQYGRDKYKCEDCLGEGRGGGRTLFWCKRMD